MNDKPANMTPMKIHGLFPVPIGMFDLDRPLTDEELLFVRGQETWANQGNAATVNTTILRSPVMASLRNWIECCVDRYFRETTNAKSGTHLRITQSWCNYTQHGQWHHKHSHSNSFISGVFYFNTNLDDRIYFHRPGGSWQQLKFATKDWNLYNANTWWFEAVTGQLLLFPSYLEHEVERVAGKDVRVSMSFNTFPVGVLGAEEESTLLQL